MSQPVQNSNLHELVKLLFLLVLLASAVFTPVAVPYLDYNRALFWRSVLDGDRIARRRNGGEHASGMRGCLAKTAARAVELQNLHLTNVGAAHSCIVFKAASVTGHCASGVDTSLPPLAKGSVAHSPELRPAGHNLISVQADFQ